MNVKKILKSFTIAGIGSFALSAAEAASLLPGRYSATLSPSIDSRTADQVEAELSRIVGLESVRVQSTDSSVRFVVRPKPQVDSNDLTDAAQRAAPGTVLSTP